MGTESTPLNTESIKEIMSAIKFIISTLAPLLAGYIGIRYGLKQVKIQKKLI